MLAMTEVPIIRSNIEAVKYSDFHPIHDEETQLYHLPSHLSRPCNCGWCLYVYLDPYFYALLPRWAHHPCSIWHTYTKPFLKPICEPDEAMDLLAWGIWRKFGLKYCLPKELLMLVKGYIHDNLVYWENEEQRYWEYQAEVLAYKHSPQASGSWYVDTQRMGRPDAPLKIGDQDFTRLSLSKDGSSYGVSRPYLRVKDTFKLLPYSCYKNGVLYYRNRIIGDACMVIEQDQSERYEDDEWHTALATRASEYESIPLRASYYAEIVAATE